MRPQIRSVPLSDIECPQFSWAIRNNSKNISTILQPDLAQQQREGDLLAEKPKVENGNSSFGKSMTCKCIDEIFKPSLFSHPATCVCSDDPCPPRDGIYRHYDLNLADQAISDIMEDMIMKKTVFSPQPRICKGDRWFKKTMISSHKTEKLPLEDKNFCSQCCNCQQQYNICKYQKKCPNDSKYSKHNYVKSSHNKLWNTDAKPDQNALCNWMNSSTSYTRENENISTSHSTGYRCNCDERSAEYLCESYVSNVSECASPIVNNSESNIEKDITDEKNNECSFALNENVEQFQNEKIKTQRKSSIEKSLKEGSTQHEEPAKLTIERIEISQVNPYKKHSDLTENTRIDEFNSLHMDEHFQNFNEINSESSSRSTSKFINSVKNANSNKLKEFKNVKLPKKKATGVNVKISKPTQKGSQKYPWNFNNQQKIEDCSKNRPAQKNLKDVKLGGKMNVGQNNFMRSRAGEDFGDSTEKNESQYFEYTPNLISDLMGGHPKTEQNIKHREQRNFNKALGKMRVQLWHEKMDECSEKGQENSNVEDEHEIREQRSDNQMNDNEYLIVGSKIDPTCHSKRKYLEEKKLAKTSTPSDINRCDPSHNRRKYSGKDGCHLSTIFEEYQEKNDCTIQNKNRYCNETNFLPKTQNECQNCEPNSNQNVFLNSYQKLSASSRLKSADENSEKLKKTHYFNVIRPKIHSRPDWIVKDLQNFRGQEFFDSHNIEPFDQDSPEHICIHRFTVDERLYPQPLHSNEFGISCCIRCDQPTKIDKTVFSDQRQSGEKGRNIRKHLRKLDLRPKPVFIGSRTSVMEIKLGPEHENLLKTQNNVKRKNNYYIDSLALRHQKR